MDTNKTDKPEFKSGFFRIASGKEDYDLITALIKARLNATEYQVVLLIIRKTWGWNKMRDWISFKQFENYTSKTASSICSAISELVKKNIVVKDSIKGYRAYYQFNSSFLEWKTLIKKTKEVNKNKVSSKENNTPPLQKTIDTIDTFTKDSVLSKDKIKTSQKVLVPSQNKREKQKCPLGENHSQCIAFLVELAHMKNLPAGWITFPKQLGFLHKLLRVHYQIDEIRKVAEELDADKFMWNKWDMETIVSRIEKKGKEVVIYGTIK